MRTDLFSKTQSKKSNDSMYPDIYDQDNSLFYAYVVIGSIILAGVLVLVAILTYGITIL